MAASMDSKIIDIDHGWKELEKTFETLVERNSYVKAGVVGEKAEEEHDGITNAELALIQEFGTPTIPSRPWIGGAFERNKGKYQTMLAKGLEKVYSNKLTVERLLGLMGVELSSDIKRGVMSEDNLAPNAPSTIRKKGSSKPLIDSNRMVGSVTHEVVMAGGGEGEE